MLPTLEQCKEFKRRIDAGRAAAGIDPIEFLDFDGAEPNDPCHCLSATNLFADLGFDVFAENVEAFNLTARAEKAMVAIGSEPEKGADHRNCFTIPEEFIKVTFPFDHNEPGLRERLVEAGVVAPLPDTDAQIEANVP